MTQFIHNKILSALQSNPGKWMSASEISLHYGRSLTTQGVGAYLSRNPDMPIEREIDRRTCRTMYRYNPSEAA